MKRIIKLVLIILAIVMFLYGGFAAYKYAQGEHYRNYVFFCPPGFQQVAEMKKNPDIYCVPKEKPVSDLSQCYEEQKTNSFDELQEPVFYSNQPSANNENDEATEQDKCIFWFIYDNENQKNMDDCERINDTTLYEWCKGIVASRLGNVELCSKEVLGSTLEVNNCIVRIAREKQDISLCDKSLPYTEEERNDLVFGGGFDPVSDCRHYYNMQ